MSFIDYCKPSAECSGLASRCRSVSTGIMTTSSVETLDAGSLQALLGAQLTAEQATLILEQGKDAVVFALLNLAKQLAETQTTPSAALPAGDYPGPDHRRLQLPPPVQAVYWRPDPDVAAVTGDPPGLVSGDPGPGPAKRRAACRRNRLAGQRGDPLVVVLRVEERHLLHDRPATRQPGLEAVLRGRVRRGVGDRLLGAYNAQAMKGAVGGVVRLATAAPGRAVERTAGAAVGATPRVPAGEMPAAPCLGVVHVLDHDEVPFDNNHGEGQIRPAVIARKNSYANGSEDGAETQAILMSVFRTL